MLAPFALVALLTAAGHSDTTLAVGPHARLAVRNLTGSVTVSTWDKSAVRVQADFPRHTRITVEGDASVVSVSASTGFLSGVEFHISVPPTMALDIGGQFTDVEIGGSRGEIKVETVSGDVNVEGGVGFVDLSSVQGEVALLGAQGRLKLSSINEGVTVRKVSGQLDVETVNGDVVLDQVQLQALEANSVSGNLWFGGTIQPGGRYTLGSHSGNIEVVMPDHPNANVTVSTNSGDLRSRDFGLTLGSGPGRGHRRMSFLLGTGGSDLDLQSFNG